MFGNSDGFGFDAPINVKPAGGGGGGIGGNLIDRIGPGVGHLNYLAVPG